MIPEIKKILYTTDLSSNSAYAFNYAVSLGLGQKAEIIILHVIEPFPSYGDATIENYFSDDQKREMSEGVVLHKIERIKDRLDFLYNKEGNNKHRYKDRVLHIEVCKGYPAEEILEKANELDCDVIVMGTHAKGFLKNAFLGSNAKRVIRRSRKPVFIVPIPEGDLDLTFHDN